MVPSTSVHALREHERLAGGRRFLLVRPKIVAVGAGLNAACLGASAAPLAQKTTLALCFAVVVVSFFAEAAWLSRRPLGPRWLSVSLGATVVAIAIGAALSGGVASPLLPLMFAPTVVGFAAFARGPSSVALLVLASLALVVLALVPPLFPPPPAPWDRPMTVIGGGLALALLAVGVFGLVDAHTRVAQTLDRMRADVLAEAERRAASLDNLGAQVAHEVKNPLTAVRGLVQLVARHVPEGRDRERLAVAVTEVDRALEVLRAYLDFARPIAALDVVEAELRAVLEDAAGVLEARAAERGVTVAIEGAPHRMAVDPQRLRDAVLNLALNAITAMPDGGPLILAVEPSASGARLVISDRGGGMSPELLGKLGRPFTSETSGGTGLGVPIARSIAVQHGGELRFESAQGAGTRAIIDLPAGART